MEEEQEQLSDLVGYHNAEQLTALNITKKSHVKKLLKQAKKQREKLGLPEHTEDDLKSNDDLEQISEEDSSTRPDGVPADAVNIMEDIERREAERKAQLEKVEGAQEPAEPDQGSRTCEDSSEYTARQEAVEEKSHQATGLHAEAERMRTVREHYVSSA